MKEIAAVEVNFPGVDTTLFVRPFGGWFVVTADEGGVVGSAVSFHNDPEEAEAAAYDHLQRLWEAALTAPRGDCSKADGGAPGVSPRRPPASQSVAKERRPPPRL